MAEVDINVKTPPKPEPPEDEPEDDEAEEPDEEEQPEEEASWQPILTEVRGKLDNLLTEVKAGSQSSQEQAERLKSLLQSSQELNRQMQQDRERILKVVEPSTPPASEAKTKSEEQNMHEKNESVIESTQQNGTQQDVKNGKPPTQEATTPPAPPPPERRQRRRL